MSKKHGQKNTFLRPDSYTVSDCQGCGAKSVLVRELVITDEGKVAIIEYHCDFCLTDPDDPIDGLRVTILGSLCLSSNGRFQQEHGE